MTHKNLDFHEISSFLQGNLDASGMYPGRVRSLMEVVRDSMIFSGIREYSREQSKNIQMFSKFYAVSV